MDLGSNGPLAVDLKAANVGLNGRKYDTVTLTSQGTRPSHTLALAVRQGADGLDLALAGASNLYRYRKPLRSAFQDHGRAALRRLGRSTPGGGYGCYGDG